MIHASAVVLTEQSEQFCSAETHNVEPRIRTECRAAGWPRRPKAFLHRGALGTYNERSRRDGLQDYDACSGEIDTPAPCGEGRARCSAYGFRKDLGILNSGRRAPA